MGQLVLGVTPKAKETFSILPSQGTVIPSNLIFKKHFSPLRSIHT